MNLEQLRKQAKELVKAARAGDPAALERLGGREPILARAQLVLAREHGYPSWTALVAAVDASVETFVRAATTGRRLRAEQLLAARPELERDAWIGLVLGREWRGDAGTAGGPLGWAPLLYACHSCFDTTSLGRELLDRGADPNAFFVNEYGRMSALYGAAGVRHDPVLTRALLEVRRGPRRRRVALPRDRGGEPRVRRDPARARRADGRDERAGARARQRAPGARPAPARPRRSTRTRGHVWPTPFVADGVRRRSSSWYPTAPTSTGRAARRGAATSRCARPTSTPFCAGRTTWQRCSPASARRPRSIPRTRGSRSSPARRRRQASRPPRSTWTCRRF